MCVCVCVCVCVQALLKLPSLSSSLEAMVKEGRQSTALLSVLTGSLVKGLASHPEDVTEPLRGLIKGKALAQVGVHTAWAFLTASARPPHR